MSVKLPLVSDAALVFKDWFNISFLSLLKSWMFCKILYFSWFWESLLRAWCRSFYSKQSSCLIRVGWPKPSVESCLSKSSLALSANPNVSTYIFYVTLFSLSTVDTCSLSHIYPPPKMTSNLDWPHSSDRAPFLNNSVSAPSNLAPLTSDLRFFR